MAARLSRIFCCEICGEHVSLNNCKTDEQGLPVHEKCYVARVVLREHAPSVDRKADGDCCCG
jgi:hypothetical protein